MDYQNAYDDMNGGQGTPDPGGADPNAGKPGYHYDPTQGLWVPDRTVPVTPEHGTTTVDQNLTGAGDTTTPPPPPPPGGGALAPFSEAAPTLAQQPAFQRRPDFAPTTFTAPTLEEAMNDPGQRTRVLQGQNSLQGWAAARGTLNDSDTAKMLIDYGQNAAEQGYGNVYARDFGAWQGNEADRFGAWSANESADERAYGLDRQSQYVDPYTAAYNAWVQRGNFYLNNQGTVAQSALGLAQL